MTVKAVKAIKGAHVMALHLPMTHYIMLEYYLVSVDAVLPMAWHNNAPEIFSSYMSPTLIL
jgi:hypothetical protein